MKFYTMWFLTLIMAVAFISGCGSNSSTDNAIDDILDIIAPTVVSTSPVDGGITNGVLDGVITATFSEAMDPATISFTLIETVSANDVPCTVSVAGEVVTFTPAADLTADMDYTATIAITAADMAGNTLAAAKSWSFSTMALADNPAAIDLLTDINYVIFAKVLISTTGTTFVTGNIGISPAAATAITGFGLVVDSTNDFSTSSLVSGQIYAPDYTGGQAGSTGLTPAQVTQAQNDMTTAYNSAGVPAPDFTELYAGNISGKTLYRGVYYWSNTVLMTSDVYLSGSATDVFIFQIDGGITMASAVQIHLTGGALAKNVFWRCAQSATIGTSAHMEGIILSFDKIIMQTGATATGRLFAETDVTLDANAVTQPSL